MIEAGRDGNYAMIGNLIMGREDGEPVPAFRERARETALELEANVLIFGVLEPIVWTDDVRTIVIEGGLERDASGSFATIGDTILEREDGETADEFRRRARDTARAAGAKCVTFGGLPRLQYEKGE